MRRARNRRRGTGRLAQPWVPAGPRARLDGYIGYFEPYATSHEALDKDCNFQAETRNVALALCEAVTTQREGKLLAPGQTLPQRRSK